MARPSLYPLSFVPLYKERVWGGRRLATRLGKSLPPNVSIGESWELVDLPGEQSAVAEGALRGQTLEQLIRDYAEELMGPVELDGGRFPALVKFIDAAEDLSVQVHPDAQAAARLGGRPKAEAWYVLDAEPAARLYLGLSQVSDAEALRAALAAGGAQLEPLLAKLTVRAGDLVPVPAGVVHAIGQGILLAEIQQPADTTYRVYDWGRLGLDGRPRELHVEEALCSTHYAEPPPRVVRSGEVRLGRFCLEPRVLAPHQDLQLDGVGPLALVGLAGSARLDGVDCATGRVVLLPHACRRGARLASEADEARVLLVTFPPSLEQGQR